MNSQLSLAISQTRYQDMVRDADASRLASQLQLQHPTVIARLARTFTGRRIARRRRLAQPSIAG
jgi:hypothetical protein